LNTYGYVGGNPVNLIDFYGLYTAVIPLNPATTSNPIGWTVLAGSSGLYVGTSIYNNFDIQILDVIDWVLNENADEDSENGSGAIEGESCPSNSEDWEKIPHSRPPAFRPKGGKEPIFQGDRAGDRSHAGSRWKKWDKARDWGKGKYRDGTYDVNGRRLRR